MKKQIILPLSFISILLLFYYFKSFFGFNSNTITVQVEKPLSIELLTIKKGFIARDKKTIHAKKRITIMKKGKLNSTIKTDYGENDFLITYADSVQLAFRHFKTNNRMNDVYDFRIFKKKNKLFLVAKNDGIDPLNFVKRFEIK